MTSRIEGVSLSGALVVLGVVCLVAPALLPADPVLYHDTRPGIPASGAELEEAGVTVVAYEDLSERGQELYVRTLRDGGSYTVARGQGASDFAYPTADEREGASIRRPDDHPGAIVIERPDNADLPPADEPVRYADRLAEEQRRESGSGSDRQESGSDSEQESEGPSDEEIEALREEIARYDLMVTQTDQPSPSTSTNLLRLLSVAVGVVALSVGGYRYSLP